LSVCKSVDRGTEDEGNISQQISVGRVRSLALGRNCEF